MKIATVTWVTYNNYGTLLQAYALQKYVEEMGHENNIISDEEILKEYKKNKDFQLVKKSASDNLPQSESLVKRIMKLIESPRRIRRILLARMDRNRYEKPYYGTQEACNKFKKEALKVIEGEILATLSRLNNDFDAFICGSDQIWSVFDSIFNPYYYLDFVNKKKIAYAPCLGTDRIPEDTALRIKELLADFSAISVRESKSALQLEAITEKEIAWVADPTLLHDKNFWSEFTVEVPRKKRKYVLCYFLENKQWYFDYAKKLAKKLNVDIVLIPNRWDYLSNEFVIEEGVGPKEFVSLIQHAEYVLTDSYHGSIFSLIFEKDFQYLLRFNNDDPSSQNIRIQSLFDYLDLNERVVTEDRKGEVDLVMEYEDIKNKIVAFREHSREFLKKSLQ